MPTGAGAESVPDLNATAARYAAERLAMSKHDKAPIDWPMLVACLPVAIGGAALLGRWVGAGCAS